MSSFLKFAAIIVLITFSTSISYGQPGKPGGGGQPVPISGIEILIGAGALMGAKKFFSHKKNKD